MWTRIIEYRETIIIAIAAFLIGFGSASLFGDKNGNSSPPTYLGEENKKEDKQMVGSAEKSASMSAGTSVVPQGYKISVANQRAGNTIVIANVTLPEASWVVIREDRAGEPGNILGAGWLLSGMHTDVSVDLLRTTVGGEKYYAVLYKDVGGDKKFDHTIDTPILTEEGKPATATFETLASPEGF